jgi:hypothetical protein
MFLFDKTAYDCVPPQVKEDLSGLKVIAKVKHPPPPRRRPAPQPLDALLKNHNKETVLNKTQDDGAFAEAVSKTKSKKERSQNKVVLDVAELFAGQRPPAPSLAAWRLPHPTRAAPTVLTLCRSRPRRRCSHPSRQRPPRPWRLRRCI